ncbi:MAG: tetratricopeptide repeat protein [Methanophagales archaeon]|nr:tetratricopeptide repeat protein [Methanophagales archaeon]
MVRYKSVTDAAGGEMEESIIGDLEEIDTIIAELDISKGKGNLILCVVNLPAYQDKIIQTLQGRFLSKVIYVENGEQIIRNLKEQDFDGAEILIWVMPEEPTEDLLNTLNNFRELFYEVKLPNLMFYNQSFSECVIRKAPDFWRYRGNYYELEEAERGMAFEAIETLATPFSYQDKGDLLRRKRINEYLLEKVRDKQEKANILAELGRIFYHLGEINNALKYFENALKLNEDLGIKEGMAADLGNIGTVYRIKGELDNALEYYGKALKLNEDLGIKEGMAIGLGNIGNVYQIKGELDKALEYYGNALKLNEDLGIKEGIAANLGNIGNVYRIKGELDNALEYYDNALKVFKEMGIRIETARTLMNIGDVFVQKGDKERAFDYYREAQGLATGTPVFEDVSKRLNKLKDEQNA